MMIAGLEGTPWSLQRRIQTAIRRACILFFFRFEAVAVVNFSCFVEDAAARNSQFESFAGACSVGGGGERAHCWG